MVQLSPRLDFGLRQQWNKLSPKVGPTIIHWLESVAGKLTRMAKIGLRRKPELTGASATYFSVGKKIG